MNTLRTHMRWIMIVIIAAFLLSTFFMYDRGSRSRGGSSPESADYVVAEVNGRQLMRSELDRMVLVYVEGMGSREITSADWPNLYQSTLNQYIMEQQMAQEVRDSGIKISDSEAEQAMKDYADQAFPTREAFYQHLERSGLKPADYKRNIAQQMASQRMINESIGVVEVNEDEATQFYENVKALFFRQPSGFNVNVIRLDSESDAEKVRASLHDGVNWNEATSGDAVASMNVLYVTPEPMFVPEYGFTGYLEPLRSMDVGAVSSVFEVASDDFAVGVMTEAIEEKITPYGEVSADIRALLQNQKERQALNDFGQGLLGRAKIVIRDETLFPSEAAGVLPVLEASMENDSTASADVPK